MLAIDNLIETLGRCDDAARRAGELARHLDCLRPSQVEPFLATLKSEAERHLTVDVQVSRRLAEALIGAAELAARPDHHALGLMAKGDALRFLGRYQEARDHLDEAADGFLVLNDEVGWARTRIGWLESSLYLGYGAEALQVVDRASRILVENEQWLRAGGLNINAGNVCYELGRYDEALRSYQRAGDAFVQAARNPETRPLAEIRAGKARANQALIYALRGEFGRALALHHESRAIWADHGEVLSTLREDLYIADVYASQGFYTRALRIYDDVFREMREAGLDGEAWRVTLNRVRCYLELNRTSDALDLAVEAAEQFEAMGAPLDAARARFHAALVAARKGDRNRAHALLGAADRASIDGGAVGVVGLVALQRARLYLSDTEWSAALAEVERARAIFLRHGAVIPQLEAELVRAQGFLGLNRLDQAAALAQFALSSALDRDVRWLIHEGYHVLGQVARARNQPREALDAYDAAVRSVERLQSNLGTALRVNFLEDKLPIFQGAIDLALRLGDPDRAFGYLERAKSRALVDYLDGNPEIRLRAPDEASQDVLDELARLRAEHHGLYNRLYGNHSEVSGAVDANSASDVARRAEAAALEAAIREREKRIGRLVEQLALRGAIGQETTVLVPPDHRTTRPPLDSDTMLLEYYLSADRAAVFVATAEGLSVVPLETSLAEIRRLVDRWQLNLNATARAIEGGGALSGLGRNARGILEALHRALLGPVEGTIDDYARLIVIPYGPLHGVPFHALYDGSRYLVERVEVSGCPSSRLLSRCLRRPPREGQRGLALAYGDDGRLPGAVSEATTIAAILPVDCYVEEQATRAAFVEAAPRCSFVHLAAHGESRPDNPDFAHLRLADGQLGTIDVFNLDLRGALVTLSGCETGRSVVAGGDELIGLSRGFLHAGATALAQSLWRVEDDATTRLMTRFYRGLAEGQRAGEALRAAQLALLAEHPVHPYFWAPFQLIGNAGTRLVRR